jgi:DNA-binding SARP family transcriptional activator
MSGWGVALCGRESERGQIADWLDRVATGQGSLLLLMGEPGVGKTVLMREAISLAEQKGLLAFDAWCRGDEWEPAWYPLFTLMEQVQVTFEQHPQAEPFSQTLQTWFQKPGSTSWHYALQIVRQLRPFARTQPFILCLDDLHQASENLLNTLHTWMPLIRQEPIGILACARSTHRNESLHNLLQETVQRGIGQWVRLANLTLEETRQLIAQSRHAGEINERAPEVLHRLTHGNPLFLTEILKSWEEWQPADWESENALEALVPRTLRSAIKRRLEQMPGSVQEPLSWMCCFEGRFQTVWLESLVNGGKRSLSKSLDVILTTGWLDMETTGQLHWAHPLVREIIYQTMPEPERAQRHRRIAETLEPVDLPAETKLLHWMKAIPDAEVLERLWSAREPARTQYAPRFRLNLLNAGICAASELHDEAKRVALLCERPHAMYVLPEGLLRAQEATRQAIAELERHPEHDPNRTLWVQMQCALAGQMSQMGSSVAARRTLERLLESQGAKLTDSQRAVLEMTHAYCAACQGNLRTALEIQRTLWHFIESHPEWARQWISGLRYTFQYALACGDVTFAQQILVFITEQFSGQEQVVSLQELWHGVQAEWAWFQGLGAELQYHARLALEASRKRVESGEQFLRREGWFHALLYRDPLQAMQQVDLLLNEFRQAVGREHECLWQYYRAVLLREGAQWDEMEASLRESLRLAKQLDNRLMMARCLLVQADAQLEQGAVNEAALTLLQMEAYQVELKLPEISIEWLRLRSKSLLAQGEREMALESAYQALQQAEEWGHALFLGFTHLQLARCLHTQGEREGAIEYLEQAENLLTAYGEPRELRLVRADMKTARDAKPETVKAGWQLQVTMLGGFSMRWGNQEMQPSDWASPRARALLCHLILQEGQPLHTDVLLEQHWGHLPEAKAKVNLQTTVSAVRRSLRKAFGQESNDWLRHEQGTYRWTPHVAWSVDAQQFEQSVQAANLLTDSTAQTQSLQHAIGLYKGDLLPEFIHEVWCTSVAHRLRHLYLEALLTLAQLHLQQVSYRDALRCCHRVLELDPCDEQACRLEMQAYEASGQRSEALQTYERCRDALRELLGAVPSPATQRLYERILDQSSK